MKHCQTVNDDVTVTTTNSQLDELKNEEALRSAACAGSTTSMRSNNNGTLSSSIVVSICYLEKYWVRLSFLIYRQEAETAINASPDFQEYNNGRKKLTMKYWLIDFDTNNEILNGVTTFNNPFNPRIADNVWIPNIFKYKPNFRMYFKCVILSNVYFSNFIVFEQTMTSHHSNFNFSNRDSIAELQFGHSIQQLKPKIFIDFGITNKYIIFWDQLFAQAQLNYLCYDLEINTINNDHLQSKLIKIQTIPNITLPIMFDIVDISTDIDCSIYEQKSNQGVNTNDNDNKNNKTLMLRVFCAPNPMIKKGSNDLDCVNTQPISIPINSSNVKNLKFRIVGKFSLYGLKSDKYQSEYLNLFQTQWPQSELQVNDKLSIDLAFSILGQSSDRKYLAPSLQQPIVVKNCPYLSVPIRNNANTNENNNYNDVNCNSTVCSKQEMIESIDYVCNQIYKQCESRIDNHYLRYLEIIWIGVDSQTYDKAVVIVNSNIDDSKNDDHDQQIANKIKMFEIIEKWRKVNYICPYPMQQTGTLLFHPKMVRTQYLGLNFKQTHTVCVSKQQILNLVAKVSLASNFFVKQNVLDDDEKKEKEITDSDDIDQDIADLNVLNFRLKCLKWRLFYRNDSISGQAQNIKGAIAIPTFRKSIANHSRFASQTIANKNINSFNNNHSDSNNNSNSDNENENDNDRKMKSEDENKQNSDSSSCDNDQDHDKKDYKQEKANKYTVAQLVKMLQNSLCNWFSNRSRSNVCFEIDITQDIESKLKQWNVDLNNKQSREAFIESSVIEYECEIDTFYRQDFAQSFGLRKVYVISNNENKNDNDSISAVSYASKLNQSDIFHFRECDQTEQTMRSSGNGCVFFHCVPKKLNVSNDSNDASETESKASTNLNDEKKLLQAVTVKFGQIPNFKVFEI